MNDFLNLPRSWSFGHPCSPASILVLGKKQSESRLETGSLHSKQGHALLGHLDIFFFCFYSCTRRHLKTEELAALTVTCKCLYLWKLFWHGEGMHEHNCNAAGQWQSVTLLLFNKKGHLGLEPASHKHKSGSFAKRHRTFIKSRNSAKNKSCRNQDSLKKRCLQAGGC